MITLTTEQAQQIEEALDELHYANNTDIAKTKYYKAISTIRAARAQEQAEQPVSQEYQDHLVNQSFDWAAMAAKHQFMEGYRIGLAEMREKCAKAMESGVLGHGECAAAIRAINFEGDTGFRPVSEMVAEHKQDPKKAAAIEKAKMRKAEQEPVTRKTLITCIAGAISKHMTVSLFPKEVFAAAEEIADSYAAPQPVQEPVAWYLDTFDEDGELDYREYNSSNKFSCGRGNGTPLYAAPVRTKDLTDEEQLELARSSVGKSRHWLVAAVIAADREKNK